MELVWAAAVTALGTVVVALVQRLRRENEQQHAEGRELIRDLHADVREVKDDVRDVKSHVRHLHTRVSDLEDSEGGTLPPIR